MADRSWVDGFVAYVARFCDAPQQYSRYVAYTIAGTVLAPIMAPLPYGISRLRPNLYTLLVGPSRKGRKSTVMEAGKQIVGLRWRELLGPDWSSYAGLLEHLEDHPVTLMFWDEFRYMMDWMGEKYNAPAKSFMTQAYAFKKDQVFKYRRVRSRQAGGSDTSVEIRGACLSQITASPCEWMVENLRPTDYSGGFMMRWLMVPYTDTEQRVPEDSDDQMAYDLAAWLARIRHRKQIVPRLPRKQRQYFAEWSTAFHEQELFRRLPHMESYPEGLTIMALKIAMIEQACRLDDGMGPGVREDLEIQDETLRTVCSRIWHLGEAVAQMFERYSSFGGRYQAERSRIKRMLEDAAKRGDGWVLRSDLQAGAVDPRVFLDALISLWEGEEVACSNARAGQRGRPREQYCLVNGEANWDELNTLMPRRK